MDFIPYMNSKTIRIIITLFACFPVTSSWAGTIVYNVKKNDTLSSILYRNNLKPIYGKKGTLVQVLKINSKVKLSDGGNKIYPGMKIILPYIGQDDEKRLTNDSYINHRTPGDDLEQSFYFKVEPALSWKNVSSKDENPSRTSKITALTNMNYGVSLAYGMHFDRSIDVYSSLFMEYVRFIDDSSIFLEKRNFF